MLEVTFYEDGRQRLSSFFATGHADAGVHGEDVVCAAVSAVLQAARLGLEEYERVDLAVEQKSGNMRLTVPETRRDDEGVRAILAAAALSVRQIAAQYPQHVRYFSGKIGI